MVVLTVLFALILAQTHSKYAGNPYQFPWVVSIRTENHQHLCTGGVISPSWIISSASCFAVKSSNNTLTFLKPEELTVIAETIKRSGYKGSPFAVETLKPHPGFSWETSEQNLALLSLKTSVFWFWLPSFVRNINPLKLGLASDKEELYVFGWATVNRHGSLLNETSLSFHSFDNNGTTSNCSTVDFICVVVQKKDNLCRLDAGSLLINENTNLVGILADTPSSNCIADKQFQKFTKLESYVVWIWEETGVDFVE